MTRIENKWIPRIPFYSPRSVFSRDIRGRDPSYIFIRRSVISLGKIRHGLVIRNEKKPAEKGRRQQNEKKGRGEARKIPTERNRVCMTLEPWWYGCTTLWLGPIPGEPESIFSPEFLGESERGKWRRRGEDGEWNGRREEERKTVA